MMKPIKIILILLLINISGCVYKIDVQQGNEITEDMIAQIEMGMSQQEVVKILGYPLITDPFHKDRWDYFYSLKEGKTGEYSQHAAALIFEDGVLIDLQDSVTQPQTAIDLN